MVFDVMMRCDVMWVLGISVYTSPINYSYTLYISTSIPVAVTPHPRMDSSARGIYMGGGIRVRTRYGTEIGAIAAPTPLNKIIKLIR